MPTYVFKGRNRLNEIVVGERVADNREALRQILRREQVTLTSVKEKGREIGIPKIGGRKKVKSKDLSVFTRQFSVMIDAGLPLVQCLEILAQQQDNKYFQQILLQVRQDVLQVRLAGLETGGEDELVEDVDDADARAGQPRQLDRLVQAAARGRTAVDGDQDVLVHDDSGIRSHARSVGPPAPVPLAPRQGGAAAAPTASRRVASRQSRVRALTARSAPLTLRAVKSAGCALA